ncbi:MAG: hypothetical protein NTW52_08975 [Planctomycetota bacterium]|nr:hypothetical protein [Planctomycetota bacterium]
MDFQLWLTYQLSLEDYATDIFLLAARVTTVEKTKTPQIVAVGIKQARSERKMPSIREWKILTKPERIGKF